MLPPGTDVADPLARERTADDHRRRGGAVVVCSVSELAIRIESPGLGSGQRPGRHCASAEQGEPERILIRVIAGNAQFRIAQSCARRRKGNRKGSRGPGSERDGGRHCERKLTGGGAGETQGQSGQIASARVFDGESQRQAGAAQEGGGKNLAGIVGERIVRQRAGGTKDIYLRRGRGGGAGRIDTEWIFIRIIAGDIHERTP